MISAIQITLLGSRLHCADYVAQNSPPSMSFRVSCLDVWIASSVAPDFGSTYMHTTQGRMHFDMFAGIRNMQREYCQILRLDLDQAALFLLSMLLRNIRPDRPPQVTWMNRHVHG